MKTLAVSAAIILLLSMAPCIKANGVIDNNTVNYDEITPQPNVHIQTYDSLNALVADGYSDMLGRYMISLTPGIYREHFSKIGFPDLDFSNIIVADNETTHVRIVMGIYIPCHYVVGDVNGSGILTGLDVTYSIRYFKGGPHPPYSCECTPGNSWYTCGDVNASCTFDGLDVTYMVRYFKGGNSPAPCPSCPPTP
jgi:hypothetical protein